MKAAFSAAFAFFLSSVRSMPSALNSRPGLSCSYSEHSAKKLLLSVAFLTFWYISTTLFSFKLILVSILLVLLRRVLKSEFHNVLSSPIISFSLGLFALIKSEFLVHTSSHLVPSVFFLIIFYF